MGGKGEPGTSSPGTGVAAGETESYNTPPSPHDPHRPEGVRPGEELSSSLAVVNCSVTSDTVRRCLPPGMVFARCLTGDWVSSGTSSGMVDLESPALNSLLGAFKVQCLCIPTPLLLPILSALVGLKNSAILWKEKPLRRLNNLPTFFLSCCSVSFRASISLLMLSRLAPRDLTGRRN